MHIYEVIKRPVITEKSYDAADFENKFTFEVDMRANKHEIREAVETAFDVIVEDVRVMVMPAKTGRRGRRVVVRKPKWKKAIVTLAPGYSIQLFEGV
ncbi:MAG: 50S ribosomal protein L23 [Caldilineae bacterium]|nr:MAG: 50S ribosomal protein L23 [Caldilineae bacterium]